MRVSGGAGWPPEEWGMGKGLSPKGKETGPGSAEAGQGSGRPRTLPPLTPNLPLAIPLTSCCSLYGGSGPSPTHLRAQGADPALPERAGEPTGPRWPLPAPAAVRLSAGRGTPGGASGGEPWAQQRSRPPGTSPLRLRAPSEGAGRGSGPQDGISESEQVGLLACVRGEVHDLWS